MPKGVPVVKDHQCDQLKKEVLTMTDTKSTCKTRTQRVSQIQNMLWAQSTKVIF